MYEVGTDESVVVLSQVHVFVLNTIVHHTNADAFARVAGLPCWNHIEVPTTARVLPADHKTSAMRKEKHS